ncbi:MAG: hypothetical protein ACOYJZ_07585 [Acutalibacter sp.]
MDHKTSCSGRYPAGGFCLLFSGDPPGAAWAGAQEAILAGRAGCSGRGRWGAWEAFLAYWDLWGGWGNPTAEFVPKKGDEIMEFLARLC